MAALEAANTEASALDVAAGPYDRRRQVTKAVPGARLIHRRRLVNDEGRELTPSELAMRRARRRRFKDEFLPRATYDKHRDGYYFGTGPRGTGYYLDETTIDYGDVDDEGYVLVRVAPPVALQRALPRRRSVDKQGLLFDEAFLDALGPAHGAPSDRYCVVAPPWLGGMPPPQERFEKEDSGGMKATFTNEMARERLAYLRRRHDEESRRRKLYPKPKTLTICSKNGAVVRLHKALDSRKIAVLEPGTTCMADEEAFDGDILRCRLVEPVRGWLSRKVVTCPDADFGTLVGTRRPSLFAARRWRRRDHESSSHRSLRKRLQRASRRATESRAAPRRTATSSPRSPRSRRLRSSRTTSWRCRSLAARWPSAATRSNPSSSNGAPGPSAWN
jgi:hypothetical protein